MCETTPSTPPPLKSPTSRERRDRSVCRERYVALRREKGKRQKGDGVVVTTQGQRRSKRKGRFTEKGKYKGRVVD